MNVALDHIIVPSHDKHASAAFLADILGLGVSPDTGPFTPLRLDDGVTLDFMDQTDFDAAHCGFRVTDTVFDSALTRLRSRGIEIYADPMGHEQGQINHHGGGRGLYFRDPSGHNMELLTAPAGVGNRLPTTTANERPLP
jgi:catechol 2,3-dioxygenase-like lactoylglutathione lyase family enzyme